MRGDDALPISNDASYNEVFEDTTGTSATSDNSLYVADLLNSAPSAITVTFSVTDVNVGHHIEIVAESTAGVYDTAPTVTSQTTTAFTVTGSLDASGTVDAVACLKDQTAPTIAQVQAGDCTGDVAAKATATQSPSMSPFDFSLVLTPSNCAGFAFACPVYDIYVTDGTTLTTLVDEYLDDPSNCHENADKLCQTITTTSRGIGGMLSFATLGYDAQSANFTVSSREDDWAVGGTSGAECLIEADSDGGTTGTLSCWIASGTFMNDETLTTTNGGAAVVNGTATFPFASGDIIVAPTLTQPGEFAASISLAGLVQYSGDDTKQSLQLVRIYDVSGETYVTQFASKNIHFWFNNEYPVCTDATRNIVVDQAVTIDTEDNCVDEDDPTLTMTEITDPGITGLDPFSAPNLSGTPTVVDEMGTGVYRATDGPGDWDENSLDIAVMAPGVDGAKSIGLPGIIRIGF